MAKKVTKKTPMKKYQMAGMVDKVLSKTEDIARRSPGAAKVMSAIGDAAISGANAVKKVGKDVSAYANRVRTARPSPGRITSKPVGGYKKGGSTKSKTKK